MSEFLIRNNAAGIHAYGVLALDDGATDPFQNGSYKDLLHTPTLTTPSATLETFGAVSFPFIVITDGTGTIRFLGTVAQNAFDAAGFIEQVIEKKIQGGNPRR